MPGFQDQRVFRSLVGPPGFFFAETLLLSPKVIPFFLHSEVDERPKMSVSTTFFAVRGIQRSLCKVMPQLP